MKTTETMRFVTDAKADYDYPTTKLVKVLGTDVRTNRELRLVETPAGKWADFQVDRYKSGFRMALSESDFARIEGIALKKAP